MRIDGKTIEYARSLDVVDFFSTRYGLDFMKKGSGYRAKQHPSLAVKADRLSWYWHSKNTGGFGVLDCLMKLENMPFREAVAVVTDVELRPAPINRSVEGKAPAVFELPEKQSVSHRLYDYLCVKRGIDAGIVNALIQDGTIYEDKRHNVVFVGRDEVGVPKFACSRGTIPGVKFHGDVEGSDKRCGFHMDGEAPHLLYVFESAIDLLSHASLANIQTESQNAWRHHNRLSLSGVADLALDHYLDSHPDIREIVLCLDNDERGRSAAEAMEGKYTQMGYTVRTEHPKNQDYNADLMAVQQHMRRYEFERKNTACR